MAINYASKYAQKIDEKFARESMTSAAVNNDYDFVGVKTVNVYSVPTAEMNDYSVSGTSRYGTPQEIENTVQEMTMTRDRSFTFTIDRGTYNDTQMSNAAGAAPAAISGQQPIYCASAAGGRSAGPAEVGGGIPPGAGRADLGSGKGVPGRAGQYAW